MFIITHLALHGLRLWHRSLFLLRQIDVDQLGGTLPMPTGADWSVCSPFGGGVGATTAEGYSLQSCTTVSAGHSWRGP